MKKILINGFSSRSGGTKNYINDLLLKLDEYKDLEITLVAPSDTFFKVDNENVKVFVPFCSRFGIAGRLFYEVFYSSVITFLLSHDVLFCPSGILPYFFPSNVKTIVAFQNMLPFEDKELKKYRGEFAYWKFIWLRRKFKNSFKKAYRVIFVSNFAKEFISNILPDVGQKSIVVENGVNETFWEVDHHSPVVRDRYVLYASSFEYYKNHIEVLKSWSIFKQKTDDSRLKLVFVGDGRSSCKKKVVKFIKENKLDESVSLLGNIPYERMRGLYQKASLNIFASTCENYPFTLIEAMSSRTPVVSSDYGPMKEIGGDSIYYFKPHNIDELATYLIQIHKNSDAKNIELADKAYERSLMLPSRTRASRKVLSQLQLL